MAADLRMRVSLDSSEFTAGMNKIKSSLSDLGVGMSALTGAGLVAIGKKAIDAASQINDLAERTGLTTDEVQKLGLAAKVTGSSTESLARSVVLLERNSAAAQNMAKGLGDSLTMVGEGGELVAMSGGKAGKAIAALGINAQKFFALSPAEKLLAVSAGLRRVGDSGIPAVFDLLGRGAGELLPLLRMNKEELQDLLNIDGVDSDTIKTLDEMGDKLDVLEKKLGGLAMRGMRLVGSELIGMGSMISAGFENMYDSIVGDTETADAILKQRFKDMLESGTMPFLLEKLLRSKESFKDLFEKPAPAAKGAGIVNIEDPAKLAAVDAQNEKLREQQRLISGTIDDEIESLNAQRAKLGEALNYETSLIRQEEITGEILGLENKVLALKQRQRAETDRLAESINEAKRRSGQNALAEAKVRDDLAKQFADEEARARIIGAADPEAQRLIEQKAVIDALTEKQKKLNDEFADANEINRVGLELLKAKNDLTEMETTQRRGFRTGEQRSFTVGGGISLGATDSMRAGIQGFDARHGGIDPRSLMGPIGGVTGKPLDGIGTRALTVQESIAKTAHDQLVALRQIATNILKINTGATAQ